ncbi:glycoside hydrolase [Acephala macrosclerotiorum]|nr:glycoside hydrolase [Acephala macrosclerotiorum]
MDRKIYAADGSNLFDHSAIGTNKTSKRWLQASGKIRGVNLGSLFVFEPWLAETEWSNMGCAGQASEFDCVSYLGQAQANLVFQAHWNSWITQSDIAQMKSYGLNTIRVPVGYWMKEDLVYSDSEHFPQGGLGYLKRLCGWASDAGFYIIIDLHGAPGAQTAQDSDTGQFASTPGFYVDYQYARAETFLSWLTNLIHTTHAFRNVGMIGIVNEPLQNADAVATMRTNYYPAAYSAIRSAESALGVAANNYLHVQPMDGSWGSGDPKQSLTNQYFMAYDDHRYLRWSGITTSMSSYLNNSCTSNRASDGDTPVIIGEFSLGVPGDVEWTSVWDPSTQQAFYKQWFAAQVLTYEKDTNGWIFWTWKIQFGDYRWSYRDAVAAGVIPTNPANVDVNACSGQ